ncbi:MAG: hypothetical protein Q9185_007119 [Variospora sp. 1 TL-2023]
MQLLTFTKREAFAGTRYLLVTLWLFTESNFSTFVLPNTAFGILGALSGPRLTTQRQVFLTDVIERLPAVMLFNWSNVLIFDLANQRYPESVKEDRLNKPWRPLPAGRISLEQTRRLMLLMVLVVLALNFFIGAERETVLLFILTWLYNDLKGGDEVVRDLIIAVAFAFYNHGSLNLATKARTEISEQGYTWIALISGVILTTMQIQDLKDMPGDSQRGRRTLPLIFGHITSRWMIAICILLWSLSCALFWHSHPSAYVMTISLGGLVAYRVLRWQSADADSRTWKLWCMWTAALYALPLLS